MKPSAGIEDLLLCPRTGGPMRREAGGYVSQRDPSVRFPIEDGIVRAFVEPQGPGREATLVMKAFYEAYPFPDYDAGEDVGTLIEKSLARGFPEMLNRSLPPHAAILEAGCGTGQLGNFLSIASRRVLSVDMSLNSLKLGQAFKERCRLGGVTFAQMNLFHLPLRPESFDIVICTGVLHHTSDPRRGLQSLLPSLKKGGYLVLGLYNRIARLKNRLRQLFFRGLGERALASEPYLAGHEVRAGKRTAWLKDQYQNPHESLHSMDEVLAWFREEGLEFIRALPSADFGASPSLEYKRSLLEKETAGTRFERLLVQCRALVEDEQGGLFIMIGRK